MRGFMMKIQNVKEIIREIRSAVIAYSGGVDSSLLARLAVDELGSKVLLVTAVSETFTPGERERAISYAKALGAEHLVVESSELDDPRFIENGPGKCFYCKSIRYAELEKMRIQKGFSALMDGSNIDDSGDFRPGARAAEKFRVRQPLKEAGVTKEEVRAAAKSLGLPMWNDPSQACLASRVQYRIPLTRELLHRVREAEEIVHEITGTKQLRVRHHGDLARIEVPASFIETLSSGEVRAGLVEALEKLGYSYVALDLKGYRSGSMNEALDERETSD